MLDMPRAAREIQLLRHFAPHPDIEHLRDFVVGFLARQHVEEIRSVPEVLARRDRLLAVA